jgi:acetyltransferase-like isoleucine patch superfamily enzyme
MALLQTIKSFLRNHPRLYALAARLRQGSRNIVRKNISGTGNAIQYDLSCTLSQVVFDIQGNNNTVTLGKNCHLNNVLFHIVGDGHTVEIGERVRFNGAEASSIWMEDSGGKLSIGDEATFEAVNFAITEPNSRITVGKDCMFAYDIDVRTGDSHSVLDAATGKRINPAQNVAFGNHIWVAPHCIILKGCTIADNCVVGTGSVVTKSVAPPGAFVAGNPAKTVKENITWDRKRF